MQWRVSSLLSNLSAWFLTAIWERGHERVLQDVSWNISLHPSVFIQRLLPLCFSDECKQSRGVRLSYIVAYKRCRSTFLAFPPVTLEDYCSAVLDPKTGLRMLHWPSFIKSTMMALQGFIFNFIDSLDVHCTWCYHCFEREKRGQFNC